MDWIVGGLLWGESAVGRLGSTPDPCRGAMTAPQRLETGLVDTRPRNPRSGESLRGFLLTIRRQDLVAGSSLRPGYARPPPHLAPGDATPTTQNEKPVGLRL